MRRSSFFITETRLLEISMLSFFQLMTGFGAPKTRHLRVTSWPRAAFTIGSGRLMKDGGSAADTRYSYRHTVQLQTHGTATDTRYSYRHRVQLNTQLQIQGTATDIRYSYRHTVQLQTHGTATDTGYSSTHSYRQTVMSQHSAADTQYSYRYRVQLTNQGLARHGL